MWWVVLVFLSYLDRELAVGVAVVPSRGRLAQEGGGPRGSQPLPRVDQAKRRGPGGPSEVPTRRSKRGFTYPGTLWCGAGNMADHYDQLGEFEETDSCCRTHDHCPHVIHAFSSKYGYTNFKWHTICHCDCDEALKVCLRRVNDTSSRVMGQAFFNVIGAPCFRLLYRAQCAERHWYGLCKRYETLPVAVLKEAVPYDYGGVDAIDVLTGAPPERKQESSTQAAPEPHLGNGLSAAGDFSRVLANVSSAGKQSQSSDTKKMKDNVKKKKAKGKKRKHKVQVEGEVTVSGGKKVNDVALRNSISCRTHTQRLSGARSEHSNDVMKDQAPMEAAQLSPSSRPAEDGRPTPPTSLREIPQPTLGSAKNLPVIPMMQQEGPAGEIAQPAVDSAYKLGVTSPLTAEESRPPARKGGKKKKLRATKIPENLSDVSVPAVLTSRTPPDKHVPQPAVRFSSNLSVTWTREENTEIQNVLSIPQAEIQNVLSIPVMPSSQKGPGEAMAQSVVQPAFSASTTSIPTARPEQQLPGEKVPPPATLLSQPEHQSPGTPDGTKNPSQERGDNEGRKKKRKVRPGQRSTAGPDEKPPESCDVVATARLTLNGVRTQKSREETTAARSKKLAETATSARAHRGFPIPQFPSLTSAPEPAVVGERRPGANAGRHVSAVQRSVERARRQFAWKRRRKARRGAS
ncbi:uncharacterized protein proca1 [Vanacampus margaritifer]